MINPANLGLEVLGTSGIDIDSINRFNMLKDTIKLLDNQVAYYNKLTSVIIAKKSYGCEELLSSFTLEELEQQQKSWWRKIIDLIIKLWNQFWAWVKGEKNKALSQEQKLQKLLDTVNKSVNYVPAKQEFTFFSHPIAGTKLLTGIKFCLDNGQIPCIDIPDENCPMMNVIMSPSAMIKWSVAWEDEGREEGLKSYIKYLLDSKKMINQYLADLEKNINNLLRGINYNELPPDGQETLVQGGINGINEFTDIVKRCLYLLDTSANNILTNIKLQPIGK